MTYTIKYYSRDTGALIATDTDVEESKANKIIRQTFNYWTATVERDLP